MALYLRRVRSTVSVMNMLPDTFWTDVWTQELEQILARVLAEKAETDGIHPFVTDHTSGTYRRTVHGIQRTLIQVLTINVSRPVHFTNRFTAVAPGYCIPPRIDRWISRHVPNLRAYAHIEDCSLIWETSLGWFYIHFYCP